MVLNAFEWPAEAFPHYRPRLLILLDFIHNLRSGLLVHLLLEKQVPLVLFFCLLNWFNTKLWVIKELYEGDFTGQQTMQSLSLALPQFDYRMWQMPDLISGTSANFKEGVRLKASDEVKW